MGWDESALLPDRPWAELLGDLPALQRILDNIALPAFVKDAAGRYVACNAVFADALHTPMSKVIGRTVKDLIAGPPGEFYHAKDVKLAARGKRRITDGILTDRNGRKHTLTIYRVGFRQPDGSPGGVVGLLLDFTARDLLEQNYRLKHLAFEQALLPIGLTNRRSEIVEVNDAFVRAWGYDSPAEVVGKTTAELVLEQDSLADIRDGVAARGRYTGEITGVRKDGSHFTVILSATLVGGPEQGVDEVYGLTSFVDITDRRRAEEALELSERKYRELVEHAEAVILRLDPEGRITFANRFAQDLFGYTEEEMLGRSAVGLIVPEVDSWGRPLTPMIDDVVHSPETLAHNENENITKRGERLWLAWTNHGLRDDAGNLVETLCVGIDETERKRADEQLRVRQAAIHSANSAIAFADLNGTITYVNPAYLQLYGIGSEAEVVGTHMSEYFLTPERAQAIGTVLRETGRWQGEGTAVRRDGGRATMQVSANMVLDAEGLPLALMASFLDITEQERLREEAFRAQRLESLGVLAGGIAHDFNNLLTGLTGQLAITRRRLDPLSRAYQELLEAEKAAMRARQLTQQLLTFSTGGAPLKRVLSLRRLLQDMVELAVSGRTVAYELDLAEDLAAVEADEGQLAQVINNLVLNALQAMGGGGELRVTAHNVELTADSGLPLPPGPYVKVQVHDTGPGIPADNLPRIFDPYYTTKATGSGLGLTIVYSVISKHGGHLAVASEVGAGTTFEFHLPAAMAAEPPAPSEYESEEPLSSTGRILVMDDDPLIRKVAGTLLRHLGYEAVVTRDGQEAVAEYERALAANEPFTAVILDLTVRGGEGGQEVLAQLQRLDPAVKALACSGYANAPIMANAAAHGFCGVVVKPYYTAELAGALAAAIRGPSSAPPA